ncbi:nuclease-related domain-containing protein [Geobacter sp. DSM 9736]|uniref:nuclease-related domain-containing protein n=1 Tax=Geobacter sp. DSM 9736 TaxID=1277350 RepID=UPI000B50DC41|nr:nuclease-related domain-containing protein [Geobacter sp. DSM 9736]SNB44824.1 Nuclease-related domain-containing protein [Geobacter sp. DSM 9736]
MVKFLLTALLRSIVFLLPAVLLAKPLAKEYYDQNYNKALFKVHTADLNFLSDQLRTRLSYYLLMNDIVALQNVLDSNFGMFGFVITDCTSTGRECPDQKILYSSSPNLEWRKFPTEKDLKKAQYILLEGATPVSATASSPVQIIARLYVLKNLPMNFDEDYGEWLRSPFKNIGPWKQYRKIMAFCLLGGILVWMIVELLLRVRRIQMHNARQREHELISNAETNLKLLEEKNAQLEEQDRFTTKQFELYLDRIKELEQRVKNDIEYQQLTASMVKELEEAKREQQEKLTAELDQTKLEMDLLRNKIAALETVSRTPSSQPASTAHVNVLEQKLFEHVFRSPKHTRGDWRIINSFNVSAGKSHSQFTDCIVISKECLIVIEAKNYSGVIESDGDFANDKWHAVSGGERREILSLWGDNPYHQVNEYCMSLMRIVQKRGSWNIPVYGVIVFPAGTDLSRIGGQIGRFYRIATLDRLVATLENIEAAARRNNAFSKRPSPRQIENLIRGREIGPA